jgi:acyl transferase domain-containing protein
VVASCSQMTPVGSSSGMPMAAALGSTVVNQDGRSASMTAPNGPSQRCLVEEAIRNAGLVASDVRVVETHGTGTALGDPIEVGALRSALRPSLDDPFPVFLGALKSNMGHALAPSGMFGLAKWFERCEHQGSKSS